MFEFGLFFIDRPVNVEGTFPWKRSLTKAQKQRVYLKIKTVDHKFFGHFQSYALTGIYIPFKENQANFN